MFLTDEERKKANFAGEAHHLAQERSVTMTLLESELSDTGTAHARCGFLRQMTHFDRPFDMISKHILWDFFVSWHQPPARSRMPQSIRSLPGRTNRVLFETERLRFYTAATALWAARLDMDDLLFATINLLPDERPDNVLNYIGQQYRSLDVPFLYSGIYVPGERPHLHLIIPSIHAGLDQFWHVDYRSQRNARAGKHRSVNVKFVRNLTGLVVGNELKEEGYLALPSNLGNAGSKVIASNSVRNLANVIYRIGPDASRQIARALRSHSSYQPLA